MKKIQRTFLITGSAGFIGFSLCLKLLERGNYILGVDNKNRGNESQKIKFIDNCPECNSKLIRFINQSKHYCENEYECRPQINII